MSVYLELNISYDTFEQHSDCKSTGLGTVVCKPWDMSTFLREGLVVCLVTVVMQRLIFQEHEKGLGTREDMVRDMVKFVMKSPEIPEFVALCNPAALLGCLNPHNVYNVFRPTCADKHDPTRLSNYFR